MRQKKYSKKQMLIRMRHMLWTARRFLKQQTKPVTPLRRATRGVTTVHKLKAVQQPLKPPIWAHASKACKTASWNARNRDCGNAIRRIKSFNS
jgi:hypothetical protein